MHAESGQALTPLTGDVSPVPERALTLKQTLFVEHYLGDCAGNATQAAKLAGYTGAPHVLTQTGYELRTHPDIALCIRARIEALTGDSTEILRQLWQVASAPTAHHMVITREEQYDDTGQRIKEQQTRMDYSSKVRALELLMKYRGMLDTKPSVEVTVKALVGVDINRI